MHTDDDKQVKNKNCMPIDKQHICIAELVMV